MKKIYFLLLTVLFAAFSNAQTTLISPTGDGGFENGATLAANGWTVVNGATNQWWVGAVATPSAGTRSAYISDDVAGATYNYNNGASSTVHFYRDVTFPAGETNITLSFKWKAVGEASYDYVTVYSMPTGVTPTVNNPAGGFQSWLNIPTSYAGAVVHATPPNLNLSAGYTVQTICTLPASYAGTTRRLVFMWSNDGSLGGPQPGSIDEISLITSTTVPTTPVNSPTALNLTAISSSQINGTFTTAVGAPDGYLVVRYPAGATPTSPANGTAYVTGSSLGTGKVVQAASGNTFSANGLLPNTAYDFYIYSYNSAGCNGGPLYKTSAPLFGTKSSLACAGLSGTIPVGPTGTYPTLTAAFAAAAAGLSGSVIFELQSTYTSATETFPITFSFNACASAGQTITVRPQTGAVGLSITSANATGTINFNGGNNIIIDGRAGGAGPSQLTISNTSLTGYAVQYINSAVFNTIKYCQVTGVNTGTASGVIFFNNAAGLTVGNSNNTIDNCDIHDGATTPTNLIYVSGNITDYASQDNNNTVSNCTIHDWFNAASTTLSAGINIVGGASDWIITANSFYQSAIRTFTMTTATEEGAILITSTLFGNNFTISNNFIGGSAPLCGGAAWTYTASATGLPIAKMIRLTTAIGAFSNITGNTIQNISITTATVNNLSGLISHVSGNANITNNTLGSQTLTGSVTFTTTNATVGVFFLPLAAGLGGVPCSFNMTNNNIGGITVANSSTGSISFRIVYTQAVAGSIVNISNNTIGGTVANSIQQTTNNVTFGIIGLANALNQVVSGNTVRNLTQNNVGATGSLTGISCQAGTSGSYTVNNNTISNLTTNGTNVAFGNAASVVGLVTFNIAGPGGNVISGNTVSNLINTNTTVAGAVIGICPLTPPPASATAGNTIISKNNINSFISASNTSIQVGIFNFNTGGGLISNNFVRLGIDATGASITNSPNIYGIYKGSSANVSVFHNTVYIGGSGVVAGTVSTFAFAKTANSTSGTADSVMNNIFVNARSNASGTGENYGQYLNASTVVVSNFNDVSAPGTGGVLYNLNGVDYTTLPAWRTATNQGWNSISGDPQLVNPTGTSATVDLHINGAIATPIEQAGYTIPSVTDDIDGQSRAAFTPVDLGADAGNFILSDIAPPVIYYTPLIYTCNTGDRVLSGVNITDATGVPTAGGLRPRIYYKKNAGAYFSQLGTLTSGTGTNGTWSFTIVATDMGGLVATDVVSYYIIAQDIVGTPNYASNPGGAVSATNDISNVTTQPTTPNTYTINGTTLSGTYNVGAAQTYTTLTAAIAAYNTACLTGPVVFQLTDLAYSASETFPITIVNNPTASAVNTLTIRPAAGVASTITGLAASPALIKMLNARYITINGVNSGGSSLTLTSANAATASADIWLASTAVVGPGCTNISILNSNINGGSNTITTDFGIIAGVDGASPSAAVGPDNDNVTIQGNTILKAYYGIYANGFTYVSAGGLDNWNISSNIIGPPTAGVNNIGFSGIWMQNALNATISGNTIQNLFATVGSAGAIYLTTNVNGATVSLNNINNIFSTASASGTASITALFLGNRVINANITRNTITTLASTTASGYGARGIILSTAYTANSNITISNNMLSDIYCFQDASNIYWPIGIDIDGSGSGVNVYYNSVNLFGSHPGFTSTAGAAAALFINSTGLNIDVRDNVLSNSYDNSTSTGDIAYAIYSTASSGLQFSTLNYNDYSVSGPTGKLGSVNAIDRLTLADIQTGFGGNANSLNVLPVFISPTNLHLSTAAGANWCLNGAGIVIAGIPIDIDADVRSVGVAPLGPDLGADEFNTTSTAAASPASQTIACGTAITTITYTGTGTTFTWTRDNVATVTGIAASGSGNISGTLTNSTAAPITVTFTITPADASGCAGPTFTATVTVNPTPDAVATPSSQTICSGTAITTIVLSSTTVGATTYAWTRDNVATVTGIAASGSGNISGTLTNTTFAPITVTFTITPTAGGCNGAAITATVLVNPTPNAIPTPSSQTICSGSAITNIVLTSSAAGTTYTWTRNNVATVTGIAASGAGSPISGTLTNTTNAPVTVTFTITPTANGCAGATSTATVLVNPIPNAVATPASQTICSGATITTIALTGNVTGTVFNWTRNNPAVTGIAASGSGDISGSLTNNTGAPVTVTFTITPTANGCAGAPITATVLVNSNPTWTAVLVQPSTCVSADGSITLTMTGPGGPYTFAWTGVGVNPTSQNQTNLTVGVYNVTVTVNATGCQSTASYTLLGPGGCFICPTIPNLTTNPSGTSCTATNNTITASGLTNMGITYGITFKYSLGGPLANPYAGGTVIATVPNAGLTGGGTTATTNATFATAGTYYIYAILSPTPVDPACRPSNLVVLTVNNNPTLTLGTSPTVCSGTTAAYLPFTSTYTGPNGNIIVNGGFETGGSAPWVVLSAQPAPVVSTTVAHTGSYSYALGSFGPGETPGDASVYQTITVPAEGGTLSYWYKPTTVDNITFDWQDAYITNTSGTILTTLMHVCSNTNVWTQVTFNMAPYAGQTVRVEFLVHGDNAGDPTNMYVDDVVLNGPGGAPATYNITWSAAATGQGFTNVINGPLPANPTPITLVVPAAAAPATYTGTITVTNSYGCSTTAPQNFTVTINPIPVVNQPASQVVCNGGTTAAVNFTSPTVGPGTIVFYWSHTASGIGLANNGTGNIPSFTAINNTNAPVVATVTVTATYTYNGVTCFGPPVQFTITINPTPTVNAVTSQTVCHNTATNAVNFTGYVPGTVYSWTNNTVSIGLAASGTGNIASFTATNATAAPVVATITVTPSYTNAGVTCTGTPTSFTITVNPRPTTNAVANQTVCNNTATAPVNFTSNTAAGNTTYAWTNSNTAIGLAAAGTGNIPSFTATNTTALPITGTITVTPTYTNNGVACAGTPISFTITVNASPTVNPVPANQVLCNGSATTPIAFTGPVSGAFYVWTNNNTSIGLGSTGTTNIPSFIATNTGTAPVTATVTVTGSFTTGGVTCTGPSVSFTITVNPTPSVNAIANQTLCNGSASAAVTITGPVPGTVFNWTNNNTSIGLAASGVGNIGSFTAINNTTAPVTANVTVTPVYTANGISCSGTPLVFTITVNPTPLVNGVASQVVCNGSSTAPITFSGSPAGTVYSWTNSNPAIGLAASGTGNIPSFTATNGTAAPITGTITVTTNASACPGGGTSFTITVNPTPQVTQPGNQIVCNGSSTAAVTFASTTVNAVFTWTNNNTTIGLVAAGTGNIPSFVAYNPTTSPVVATITVTATTTNGGVSCSGPVKTFTITVNPGANIVFTNVPIRVCLTDTIVLLTATPAGGVWAGPGISGNTFNAATAGLGVKVISYTVTNSSGCSGTSVVNVTVNDCIERHNVLRGAIRIYPDPNTGQFNIRFLTDVYKGFNMDVIDGKGAVLKTYTFTGLVFGSVIPMDLRSLPSGYYRLVVYNTQERATFPMIIGH